MDKNIKIFSLIFFAASQGFGGNERTFLDIYQLCKWVFCDEVKNTQTTQ